jgi:membrane carboxypeptidase/penicillin-binding protein PbpC
LAANAWCPTRRQEWVTAERQPLPCSWHHLDDHGLLVIWPPEYRQWAQSSGLVAETRRTAPSSIASERENLDKPTRPALAIVNPPAGATYLIDPTLRREFQTLAFRATVDRSARIVWSVNGRETGTARSDTAFMWPLAAGRHHITARDDQGRTAETTIVVR